jgi:thymidylate synthase (FAD)
MKAELIDHMGSDLTVVNAARVSFDKESGWERTTVRMEGPENFLKQSDEKLIRYLATHHHFTPFTHCQITLRETVPIFVARQRFKHTVGFSYNEVSRRYVDDDPEFYTPSVWRGRPVNAKQGSSDEPVEHQDYLWESYNALVNHAATLYDDLIQRGVAPEQARMVLPQSMYTSYYVTGSLAAFARAYALRSDPHAQLEIQELAKQWDSIIRPLFPVAWSALVDEVT